MKDELNRTDCSPTTEREHSEDVDSSTGGSPRKGGCPECGSTDYHCIDFTMVNQCMECETMWAPADHVAKNERSGAGNTKLMHDERSEKS